MQNKHKPVALRLALTPPPSGEDWEKIEDLIASTLRRHGWRGSIRSDATGNTVTLKFLPQVDDGHGYPPGSARRAVESQFAFIYRCGEMTAAVRAASREDAWNKLYRVLHGGVDDDVVVHADSSCTHPDLWVLEGADG